MAKDKKEEKVKTKKKHRVLKSLLITLLIITTLFGGGAIVLVSFVNTLDPMVQSQVWPTLRYVPGALITYPFKAKTNASVTAALAKTDGFIKGICHPSDDYGLIKGAGIEWDRADIPYPFDIDGNVRQSYTDWKVRMQAFVDNGISIFAVTPYPEDFLDYGIDPRLVENEVKIKAVAEFLIKDLSGIISGLQITNELGVDRFMYPLTTSAQAVRFMGIQLEAIAPFKGDVIVGYNSAGPQADHHSAMKAYHKYCDYIGVDIYAGCFDGGLSIMNSIAIFDLIPAFLWSLTGLPVIMCEFGYISGGMPKTDEERLDVLREYGYNSEAEARADIDEFVKKLPSNFQNNIKKSGGSDPAGYIFSDMMSGHLYRELPANIVLKDYPHTPQGQADFYSYMIPRLASNPYVIGEFVYCWSDSERCYICGFDDCPIETRWGLVDKNQVPKPAYEAVRAAFAKIP
ncbi:MAG: hypothetical protein LBT30_08465 [Clostridiales bacterium]|jgi:hypothetical protein|nr:hypothetical protein [Clostridiales bacterium]